MGSSLDGRVVVVAAGDDPGHLALARALAQAGAVVAVVAGQRSDELPMSYRGDIADRQLWERVAPHVEQRLGPVDLVAGAEPVLELLSEIFGADLRRRRRPDPVLLPPAVDVATQLSRLAALL